MLECKRVLAMAKTLSFILYPGRGLNPHDRNGHRILSPACLPIPPPGQSGANVQKSVISTKVEQNLPKNNSTLLMAHRRIIHRLPQAEVCWQLKLQGSPDQKASHQRQNNRVSLA